MSQPVRSALDTLTAEKGTKEAGVWRASLSVKDVIEKAGLKNTLENQRYVVYVVQRFYEGCQVKPGQGDNGGFLEMKIRSV